MQWEDDGIVLASRRHGESGLIVHLLTRGHGRHAGLVRGGQGPKLRAVHEIGNHVKAQWNARLAEHLGILTCELMQGHAATLIDDPARLACLSAAVGLAEAALPEREPHRRAFQGLEALLAALDSDRGWAVGYVEWEMLLLAELGFGLDLSRCAATGSTEDLVYVSPRSGQAVSVAAGEPYREKLLALPRFLGAPAADAVPEPEDVVAGVALTGHFLDTRVFAPHDRAMPPARERFVDLLGRMAKMARAQNS